MRKETEQGNKDGELFSFTSNQITQLGRTIPGQPSDRLLHGNRFTKRQEQRLLKTTRKGFQVFDNETAFLLEPFPTTPHTKLWFEQHVFVSLLISAVLRVLTFLRRSKPKITHFFSTKLALRDLILHNPPAYKKPLLTWQFC